MTAEIAAALADEVDGIALIIASTSGSAGAPALTAAEAIVEHLASVVSRRDADLRTRIETLARKWDDTRCGVMSPGLHRAADELRASLPNNPPEPLDLPTRSGHFTGGLLTDDNARGVRFVEDAARSRRPADTDTGRGQ